jgi:hypothetical protein
MAMNQPIDVRQWDRRIFASVAILFPVLVLIGFAPTYYLKLAFGSPPLPSLLVHVHGLAMSAWVGLFITQVYLISSKRIKLHQRLGIAGVILAVAVIVVGFMTGVASAARGASVPGVSPLSFMIVPVGDVVIFAILFAGAVYYRKKPANHKRLMLLTVLNFLPPALGRFPFEFAGTPPFFFGVPDLAAILFLVFDTWKNRKLNKVFLAGAILLIASHPIRIILSTSDAWMRLAEWLTSFA